MDEEKSIGYKLAYKCSTIGCQSNNTKFVDGTFKCVAHAPLHCDYCSSTNVYVVSSDRRKNIRIVECSNCKKQSRKFA